METSSCNKKSTLTTNGEFQDKIIWGFIDKTNKNPLYFQNLCGRKSKGLKLKTLMKCKDRTGQTILHHAVEKCNLPLVTKLLEIGADVNTIDTSGEMPIMKLGQYWHRSADIIPYDKNNTQKTLECNISSICVYFGAKTNLKGSFGRPLLTQIAEKSCALNVRELIRLGAPVDEKDDYGRTAFMIAANKGRIDIMKQLLGHGANINTQDSFGNTAIILSIKEIYNNYMQTVTSLIELGADLNLKDREGKTISDVIREDIYICKYNSGLYCDFVLCGKCSNKVQLLKLISQTRHCQNKSNKIYSKMFLLALGESKTVLFNLPLEITIMIFDYLLAD